MNKIIHRVGLLILCLSVLILLPVLAACGNDAEEECKHSKLEDTLVQPDCSLQGYILHTCRDCDYSYKSDFTEPKGHTFSVGTHEPTCTEQGSTAYVCEVCDYSYTAEYKAPLGHKLKTAVTAPTCTEGGSTLYVCERDCGYSYTSDFVEPTGHDLQHAPYAATCTTGAYSLVLCSQCDYSYRLTTSKPMGHTFTATTYYPSIQKTGYTSYACPCGYSYIGDYVWYSDIFKGSAGDGTGILATGIDLSYHNTDIDWDALAATGIDYVILRAASGVQLPDRMFEDHYANARRVGLDIGCYFYSYAMTVEEAKAEAEILLDIIEGKQFEYPVYFDLEDPSQRQIPQETLMGMCRVFCETIAENGYFPAVYTNNNWLVNLWHTEELTTLYDIWYARYPLDDDGLSHFTFGAWYCPIEYNQYGMWQYTEYGRIAGVTGDVDLDFCYKDYPTLIKKYGYNGFEKQ